MSSQLKPTFLTKSPLHCDHLVDIFHNVDTENNHKKRVYNLHVLDGDFNAIRLTIDNNKILFDNIITVHHKNKKENDARWQQMGYISTIEKILHFMPQEKEVEKHHDSIIYTCSQIYWTLSGLDTPTHIREEIHAYRHRTKNCPFCNRHNVNHTTTGYQGCNRCWKIWSMF